MPNETLCAKCGNGVFCPSWGEWKCLAYERRMYYPVVDCSLYEQDTREKKPDCGCETCVEHGYRYEDDA